ncbi:MAG: fused MFS/spermidine synthase [Planctomycetota bacterium]
MTIPPTPKPPKTWAPAMAVLMGAFLVFQVQPVISKTVLPWYGGTPAVWTTCMLFFQVLLFAGYLYAHALRSWLSPRWQAVTHLLLMLLAVAMLPIAPSADWKPDPTADPMGSLLMLLSAHVAVPYFTLASTGPLVQAWLSYRRSDAAVYRLYALSNIGSLAALLSYPFLVEPFLSIHFQSNVWAWLFATFVIVMSWLAVRLITRTNELVAVTEVDHSDSGQTGSPIESKASHRWHILAWIGFPNLASILLLVITSHVCQDVAVIPFLWVLPLSLYLLTFIISFDSPGWYRPKPIAVLSILGFILMSIDSHLSAGLRMPTEVVGSMMLLFGVCLLCHGETARLKPNPKHLTLYYTLISAGGAIGGITVAMLCPWLLNDYREFPIAIAVSMGMAATAFLMTDHWKQIGCNWSRLNWNLATIPGLLLLTIGFVALMSRDDSIENRRNFFGVLRVESQPGVVRLVHGSTVHGIQMNQPHANVATSYYGVQSGVGQTLAALMSEHERLEIGVVGLGCGVLATYQRESDRMDFFEINPDVIEIANQHFSFLKNAKGEVHSHLGDGRLLLQTQEDQRFDLLVLDAFSSDAIPAHLLTLEAMQLYRSRLKQDGILAIHVSNNHLDLVPLTQRLASEIGFASREVKSRGATKTQTRPARWVIATGNREWLECDSRRAWRTASKHELANAPLWTDQQHNLASVLIWPSL